MPKTFQNPAVPSTYPVVFVQGNKIIGKGRVAIRHGDNFVGVRVDSGPIAEMVKDLELVTVMGLKCAFFRFMPFTGVYAGDDHQTGEGGTALLQEVRVVDAQNLAFGIVPESFKDVEGYRSALSSSAPPVPRAAIPEDTATPTYNHTIGSRGDCYFVCQSKIIGKGSVHAIAGGIATVTANAGLLFSSLAQLNRVVHGNLKFRTTTGEFIDAMFGHEPDTHKVVDFLRTVSVVRCIDFHAGGEGVAHFSRVPGFGQPQPESQHNALYVGASLVDADLVEPNVPEVQLKLAEEALSLIANVVNWDTLTAREMAQHASAVLKRIQSLRHD